MSIPERCPNCDAARVPYPEADTIYTCGSFLRSGIGFVKSEACKHRSSAHCKPNTEAEKFSGRRGKLLPDADEINATVQIYKRLGLKSEKLIDDVQSIVDKIKTLLPFAKEN